MYSAEAAVLAVTSTTGWEWSVGKIVKWGTSVLLMGGST
jgi:hypothetical protein